jgi:hypothetical protein
LAWTWRSIAPKERENKDGSGKPVVTTRACGLSGAKHSHLTRIRQIAESIAYTLLGLRRQAVARAAENDERTKKVLPLQQKAGL